jgi:hypothetical protein
MGAIIIDIIKIDGTHDIPLLPHMTFLSSHDIPPMSIDVRAALNGICSEIFCSANEWGPWHFGRARAWAQAQGCPAPVPGPVRPGPRPGPGALGPGPGSAHMRKSRLDFCIYA